MAASLEIARPPGRLLDRMELRRVVASLAGRRDLWEEHVRLDPWQRTYEQLLSDEHLTVWLNCWMDDHDTGFHDHDVSAGAVAVVEGSVIEERLRLDGLPRQARYGPGGIFDFGPSAIHRVCHGGGGPAVSLHAYSPPLLRTGSYALGEDGVLERLPLSSGEELRALTDRTPAP